VRELDTAVRDSWRRFLDTYEPLRPDLYRYCRHLTKSPWDAEDMAQDTLARAFVTLGCLAEPPANPRAWLFRVASNLWINRLRRAREVPTAELPEPPVTHRQEPMAAREAAGTLLSQLSPQERAAVVLKDVFDFSLEEAAESLATTVGAVKAALHSGRAKLLPRGDREERDPAPVPPAVLDAFCAAFNAGDLEGVTALLLDTATMEFPGIAVEYGKAALRAGSLGKTLFGCESGGTVPAVAPRSEVRVHRGEAILLWWWGDAVHAVVRVELREGRIAAMRDYHHAPELVTEVCRELGVPYETHGYHPWPRGNP
jgi:RNA polymerase sigma-70 factor (ECF subfamily)